MLWFGFVWLNRRKMAQRVAVGKPAKIIDRSMLKKIDRHVENVDLEDVFDSQKGAAPLTNAGLDLTDFKNDEVRPCPPARLMRDPSDKSLHRNSSSTSTRRAFARSTALLLPSLLYRQRTVGL